jgi:cation diffusion facilitator CzcD-associated flavoprotein CzcO
LARLATDANAGIEVEVVADHGDPGQGCRPVADQGGALHRTGDLAVLDEVGLRALEDELAIGDVDLATAEALKPYYGKSCKRLCFHDEYLQSFNRPNVHLVDTDGRGVEAVTPRGVLANGREWSLDCIIYASGFEVGTAFTSRSGFDPVGRDGVRLSEAWADGMVSLHGMHVRGFPNMYVVGPSQAANLISNIPHNLVEAGRTIAAILAHAREVGARIVETTEAAQHDWVALLESNERSFGGDPTCTPGYYNNEGQAVDRAMRRGALGYPEGPVAFFSYIDRWRSDGTFEGLRFGDG